jgi:hypothetical protein
VKVLTFSKKTVDSIFRIKVSCVSPFCISRLYIFSSFLTFLYFLRISSFVSLCTVFVSNLLFSLLLLSAMHSHFLYFLPNYSCLCLSCYAIFFLSFFLYSYFPYLELFLLLSSFLHFSSYAISLLTWYSISLPRTVKYFRRLLIITSAYYILHVLPSVRPSVSPHVSDHPPLIDFRS